MITLIVARAPDGAIGKDNTIPWHAPEDLKMFQRETLGGALIMGRNTWDSLPVKPLKNRLNLVVSSRPGLGDQTCSSLEAAVETAYAAGYRRIYGMGGARIYAGLMPMAHRLLITEVAVQIDGADTFFPAFDPAAWSEVGHHVLRDAGPRCVLHEYVRA